MKIEILGASAPKWANEEKTAINLQVRFSHLPGLPVPFTATASDTEAHGRELWTRAKFGEYGEIGPYTGPTKEQMEMATFPTRKRQALEKVEAQILPLQRAVKFGMASNDEVAELEKLERYTVALMRAEGPDLPLAA
ncbi:putative tail protein [Aeromonas phage AhyVDH1]|nr:putative tail protein [Aeromonas phage AhyVDH1]